MARWLLVKTPNVQYSHIMLKECVFAMAVLALGISGACGDSIQLKDKASVVGTILAEKHDQVVVDIGYTVLTIPRNQVLKISKSNATERGARPPIVETAAPEPVIAKTPASPPSAAAPQPNDARGAAGFYVAPNKPMPVRSVRDLVNQVGEAVVQVRTPSGLGSGLIINEDGFLMTNFHVIEGETQISVEVYHQKNGELIRKSYKDVRIIAINKFEDLALLKIEDKAVPKFKYIVMGSGDALAVGERVFAI